MKLKNMNKKWMKRATLVVILGGLIYGGYSYTNQDQDMTASASASTIQEYTLTKSQITETLSTSGTVQADSIEQLLGDVTSEVTNIYVEIGDEVSVGQVLAEMNPIDVQSDILNQQVVIANLEKEIKTLKIDKGTSKKLAYDNAKVSLDNAKSDYDSNVILFENGALSQSDLDQSLESYNKAISDYESAKSTYESYDYATEYSILEKKLQVENTKLESLEQDILDHQVVASIDGVVTALNIEEGEVPKESDVMMEIQDLSNLKIEASISEYEINDIAVGQEVTISTLGNEDKTYSGVVERIYPSGEIEGSEVFVTVLIEVLDEDQYLKPNFSANIDILIENKEDALLVPYDALITTPKGYALQLKTEDEETANMVRVETGIEGDLTIEVISDQLEEGMVILVDSSVDISTSQRQGGMMIPGMGGPPEGGGKGQRNKKAGN
jgi:HlyD family secretion protein